MKTLIRTTSLILAWVVPALAANGSAVNGNGLLMYLFIGIVATIVVFQLTPAMILFATMVKELFTPATKRTTAAINESPRNN